MYVKYVTIRASRLVHFQEAVTKFQMQGSVAIYKNHTKRMASNYVGLNVGGVTYLTSRETLTRDPDSFFTLLLSDRVPSAKDSNGNYLIDRDGGIFRHVLNFMRCGKLVLPGSFSEFHLLACEAEFFQLEALQRALEDMLPSRVTITTEEKKYEIERATLAEDPANFITNLLIEAWNWNAMNGDLFIQKNFSGDYTIKGDLNMVRLIMKYLETGQVHTPVLLVKNPKTLKLLKKQACHFRLENLMQHIQDIENFLKTCSHDDKIRALLYFLKRKPRAIYTNHKLTFSSTESFYALSSSSLDPICSSGSRTVYGGFLGPDCYQHQNQDFWLQYSNSMDNMNYGDFGQQLPMLKTASSEEDVIAYFAESFRGCQMKRTQLSDECTKVEYIL